MDRLIAARSPRALPPLTVSPRRLYILPTGAGALYALLLLVMLLGATNYGNNLAFTLTFWLAAVGLVSMHRSHRNLAGLVLTDTRTSAVFAGSPVIIRATFANASRRARRRLQLGVDDSPTALFEVENHHTIDIALSNWRRGRHRLPVVHLESRYPLGLFRCWTRLAPAGDVLVYPHPHGVSQIPQNASEEVTQGTFALPDEDHFSGLRVYREGDNARDIDWKHSARSSALLVRESARARALPEARFDYAELSHLAVEDRLSQLTLWVIEAENQGRRYTLLLPAARLGPDTGSAHRAACLEALAVFA